MFLQRLELETGGFVPWRNLIVTYDNEFGSIDLRIVESEIRNKLLKGRGFADEIQGADGLCKG